MAIILEGPDNGGKSTLASKLALRTIHPGAPPKTRELEDRFFSEQLSMAGQPVIYDRITCISQQVYQKHLFDMWYMVPLTKMLRTPHCVVIYCRPDDSLLLDVDNHTVAAHDTQEMLDNVRNNVRLFIKSYDSLMEHIPHIKYDYNKGMDHDTVVKILKMQFDQKEWKSWMREHKKTQGHSWKCGLGPWTAET